MLRPIFCNWAKIGVVSRLKLKAELNRATCFKSHEILFRVMKQIKLPVQGSNEIVPVQPSKIICLGLNYQDHIEEFDRDKIPDEPVLFPKMPSALIGPGDPIVIPRFVIDTIPNYRIDFEAELALMIGKVGKNIPKEDALDYVKGFFCLNDVSQREIQKSDISGWFRGKSFDTFAPIGPKIVPIEGISDPNALEIKLWQNGVLKQRSNTQNMIFSLEELISYISKNMTLWPGDIISTGTPSGVGPIKEDDVIKIEIEQIGVLENPVVEEKADL